MTPVSIIDRLRSTLTGTRHKSLYGQGIQSIIGEYKWWMRTRPSFDAQGAAVEWVRNRPKVVT